MFVAPPPPGAMPPAVHPEAAPRRPRPADDAAWSEPSPERPATPAGGKRKAAGLALLAIGVLHLVFNAYDVGRALFTPGAVRKEYQDTTQQMQGMFPGMPPPMQFDPVKVTLVLVGVFGLFSLAQLVGGLSLLKGRYYPLALLGAIVALVNCGDPCCLVSAPVGIWALVVLFDPNVRAEFV
jgi:hypothetical protein